jgi:GTPase SAR1 family protein
VKLDKKNVDLGERAVNLILWDVASEDDISTVRMAYLRGCAGYVLVADGCVYRKPRPLDLVRESLNVGRNGRVDLSRLEPGCLALQAQVAT